MATTTRKTTLTSVGWPVAKMAPTPAAPATSTRPAAASQMKSRLTPVGPDPEVRCSRRSHTQKTQRDDRPLGGPALDQPVDRRGQHDRQGGDPHRTQAPPHAHGPGPAGPGRPPSASTAERGWMPKASQWSTGRVPRILQRKAKTMLRMPVTTSTAAATWRTPAPEHPLHQAPTWSSGQVGPAGRRADPGDRRGVRLGPAPGRALQQDGAGAAPRAARGTPPGPGRPPAPRRRTGRPARRAAAGAGGTAGDHRRRAAPGVGVEALDPPPRVPARGYGPTPFPHSPR